MAKEFDEIMQDMKAWQGEKDGRAIICFAVEPEDSVYHAEAGRGADIIAAMAYQASKSKDTVELMVVALMMAKIVGNGKDDVDDDVDKE